MTFEGKPIDKPAATKEEPKSTIPPPRPAKKSHKFRNFLLTTLTLGSVVYIGGAWYALQDDNFQDYYVDYLPFGENLIALLESRQFQRQFSSIPGIGGNKTASSKDKTLEGLKSVSVSQSGATWKAVEEPAKTPAVVNIAKSGPHLSATNPQDHSSPSSLTSAIEVENKSTTKPASSEGAPGLPLIRIPNDTDPLVANSIHSLNNLIASVNESKHSKEHIDKVSKEIAGLTKAISEIKDTFKSDLSAKLKEEAAKAGRLVEARTNELRLAVAAQEEKWNREFHEEQQRLAQSFNERLHNEVTATNKVIFALANNQLLAVHVEREKQFAAEVAARVEKERDARFSKLEQLAKSLSNIEDLTAKADKVISESENAAQLHIAIGRLKGVLESNENVVLGPYIEAIRKTAGSDPLLLAALERIPKDVYESGVLTPAQLTTRFQLLEPEIRKASLLPPNAGVAGHFGSIIFSKLLWKKSGNATGEDVESILSRADTALSEGRIVDAVGEVNTLKGWPKRLAHDWLAEGRKRSELEFLVDVLAEEGKLWGLEL